MPRRLIDPVYKESLRRSYFAADTSDARRRVIASGMKTTGYSRGALYRVLSLKIRSKKPNEVSIKRAKTIDEYAKMVWDSQQEHSKGVRKARTAPVYRHLVEIGTIPSTVKYHHIASSIRRQEFKRKAIPLFRPHERELPLSVIQIDFTRSAYCVTVKKGDKQSVKLSYSKGANGAESRVWIGVAIDDASRVMYARYYIASGESAKLAQVFMLKAFSKKCSKEGTPLALLQGMPNQIYTDRGSGFRNAQTAIGLRRLGITHAIGANEKDKEGKRLPSSNKQGRGKVERMMQVLKDDFELSLMLKFGVGTSFTVKELNQELTKWLIKWNMREHPTRADVTRWEVFEQILSATEYPEENAADLFYTSTYQTVHRGQVRGDSGVWCKAPNSVAHQQRIEVITLSGRYFTIVNEKRVEMEVISDRAEKVKKSQTVEKPVERVSDYLEGLQLRSRLSEEIERSSAYKHNLGTVSSRIQSELDEFLGTPRSIKEIKQYTLHIISSIEEHGEFTISESGELVRTSERE